MASQLLEITRKVEFDAGHRIPNHQSKCRHVHGHRYVLECTVTGPIVDTSGHSSEGMIVDFGALKAMMLEHIADRWDHAMLVWEDDIDLLTALAMLSSQSRPHRTIGLPCIPTVENLAALAYTTLYDPLMEHGLTLTRVRLYETPNCWADYNLVSQTPPITG